jgi:hypothetical protein
VDYGGLSPSAAVLFNTYSGSPGSQGIALRIAGVRQSDYLPTGLSISAASTPST